MDLTKAQRLLNKIQAFLDDGHAQDLSRLEKDLIKSYVQQLYEAVTSDDVVDETPTKIETPSTRHIEIPKAEPHKPFYSDYIQPTPKQEPPVYQEYKPHVVKEKPVEFEVESKPYEVYAPEPKKEIYEPPVLVVSAKESNDILAKLFDLQKSDDMASRFGHVPIESIESAMGLNERIFTLNELFGGDKALFDAWCTKLNGLHSFAEAKHVLIAGPAKDFKWSEPERIKMAEQFIRIVSRRYPKPASS